MSLRTFHVLFVTISVCCCATLAAWAVMRIRAGDVQGWWLGALAAAAVAGLAVYLPWFLGRSRRMP